MEKELENILSDISSRDRFIGVLDYGEERTSKETLIYEKSKAVYIEAVDCIWSMHQGECPMSDTLDPRYVLKNHLRETKNSDGSYYLLLDNPPRTGFFNEMATYALMHVTDGRLKSMRIIHATIDMAGKPVKIKQTEKIDFFY